MLTPSAINLNKDKTILTITFNDQSYKLSSEYLRVYSPSAEVVGHGIGQEVLQVDKEHVIIENIKATGNYAVILFFSDGHDSGIYSFEYLYKICINHDKFWQRYLQKLKNTNHTHSQIN